MLPPNEWPSKWYGRPLVWVELFALVNLGGMAPDIFLAHRVNFFHSRAEYIPLVFSIVAPVLLLPAFVALLRGRLPLWRTLGLWVGWAAIIIGITGLMLHLRSQFFQQATLASLVYAAPFAAPLAYTGVGLLLLLNRMMPAENRGWPLWVIFLALGGFAGNFIFSVTDHAQNGFYHITEWIPVASSALAVGFLLVPLLQPVSQSYIKVCAGIMLLQAAVGLVGAGLHARADFLGTGPTLLDRIVYGAPIFAPMLFPDLVLLAGIGLWALYQMQPPTAESAPTRSAFFS
ncbi:MAG TPA: hypothetical protein VL527_07875 [Dongiaceae bacterium]|nr:hypothetical protein [Dongiaceae bacterium]